MSLEIFSIDRERNCTRAVRIQQHPFGWAYCRAIRAASSSQIGSQEASPLAHNVRPRVRDESKEICRDSADICGGLMRPFIAEDAERSTELRRRAGRLGRRQQHEHADRTERHCSNCNDDGNHIDKRGHDDRVHAAGNGDDDVDRAAGIDRRNAADRQQRTADDGLHTSDDIASARAEAARAGHP